MCVSFSQKRDAGLWEPAAVWLVQPWPGSLLTPANRAWAFLVPPTSCWQRSGHVLLRPLTQVCVIWKNSEGGGEWRMGRLGVGWRPAFRLCRPWAKFQSSGPVPACWKPGALLQTAGGVAQWSSPGAV